MCIWCVYLCDVCMEMAQTWRSEDLFWESIFFPSTLGWNLRWSGLQNYHFYSKVSLQPISINLSLFALPPPLSISISPFWTPKIEPSASHMPGTGTLHWITPLNFFVVVVLWCIFFFEKESCTSDCPQTCYVSEAGLKVLLGPLVLPLEC